MTNTHVVAAGAFASRIANGSVRVIDARFDLTDPQRGERDHGDGHIAGACYAHLDRDLSDLSKRGEGRHPLPDQAAFSSALARWGLSKEDDVVVYDAADGALAAARLWWLLRIADFTRVAVLDGGIAAWRAHGGELVADAPTIQKKPSVTRFDRDQIVWYDELEQLRLDPKSLVVDARAAPRFRGEIEPIDAKAGHVPGSVNRPFTDNLDRNGCFKPASALRVEFDTLLAGRDPHDVVHLCGSGVTACHNALAMAHAGLTGSRVFAPSWSGWIDDVRRPIATGPV